VEAIFDRFQQADEDTTRKYGGTGLGLSIVKQLVELQNGTIHVSSELNKGTEFVFSIPYVISKDITTPEDLGKLPKSRTNLIDTHLKILIAEDNVMNQNLMRHLLTHWNLDFDIVNNGKEAIEALQKNDYRLLLMDIQMPLMDGYTTTMKIRNELGMNIPIVAMTAHAMTGERDKCLSYGMNEYISKPIREKELFQIIEDILKSNGRSTELEDETGNISFRNGRFLNLDYLKEISGGNAEFEKSMIEQFLIQVPGELEAMKEAFNKADYAYLAHIAHNLKTSVSFMGLGKRLDHFLNYIESSAATESNKDKVWGNIMSVHDICQKVFQEAKDFIYVPPIRL
jgi:CheY-like chemotaxis protein